MKHRIIALAAALPFAAFAATISLDRSHPCETVDLGATAIAGNPAFTVSSFAKTASGKYPRLTMTFSTQPTGGVVCAESVDITENGIFTSDKTVPVARHARLNLENAAEGGAVAISGFRLINDRTFADDEQAGSFKCDDATLNGQWAASVRTCELCALPRTRCLVAGARSPRVPRERDFFCAVPNLFVGFSSDTPFLEGTADALGETNEWALAALGEIALYRGDAVDLAKRFPSAEAAVARLFSRCRGDGLMVRSDESEPSLLCNLMFWKALKGAALVADVLGKEEQRDRWSGRVTRLASAIRKQFRLEKASRECRVMALAFGFATPEEAKEILGQLPNSFSDATMDALAIKGRFYAGDAKGALRALASRPVGSVISSGSDPCCPAAGVAGALTAHVLGIAPKEPGYRRFTFTPPKDVLTLAEGEVPTPHGMIAAKWRRTEKGLKVNLFVPNGTVGEFSYGKVRKTFQPGPNTITVPEWTRAIDLSDADQRAAQPSFVQPSYSCGIDDGLGPDGRWSYRFHVTQAWNGALPQWPSVNLKPAVTDWSAYDRFVVDVFNDAPGGDVLSSFISQPDGRLQNGLSPRGLPLDDGGFHRWVIELRKWPQKTNPKKIGRVHFFFTTPTSADVRLSGFYLLKPGEPMPAVSEKFLVEKVRPAERRAEAQRIARRTEALATFKAKCRAAGQTGEPAWFGKASSMRKVRPRDGFDVDAADRFSLALARGEYESLQVLVLPDGRDLAKVSVVAEVPGIAPGAIRAVPVGYVQTIARPPYKVGYNVATNLPGGYARMTRSAATGWWPDPILDWMDSVNVCGEDMQGFWVRMKCPDDQKAGVYEGRLVVRGEGWQKAFPLSVRVFDFAVPKKSPLPMAITFSPGPHLQYATKEDTALAKRLWADPASPVNAWRAHEAEWGDFLADYYITMDSLYHRSERAIHWSVLRRLKEQKRLGLFNLGYWTYPTDMKPETLAKWTKETQARFDPAYAKAKALGLLDHAYLYGCDEISPKYFPNIAWALGELKRRYPEVPRFTTAYDHDFGVGGSKLSDMDWFTPLTPKYAENFAKVAPSRASGHQVWWYICCGPHAPHANMFVECEAIEARQLMGAQTVKWRPDGFLYYQLSIWNALKPISGKSAFTDWNPRSWTRYHGDGSWFCCGPEGRPCATIRMENFRDGLEDYAYALEYERRTGKRCEVPDEVCRSMDQFSSDPEVYSAWRIALAERIERAGGGRTVK